MFIERTIDSPVDIFASVKSGRPKSSTFADTVYSAIRTVFDACEHDRTIRELGDLSDHLLDDIGLDRFRLDQATRDTISRRNRRRLAR